MTEEMTALESFSGTTTEIDGSGDLTVDTTEALAGDVRIRLASGRSCTVQIDGTTVFEISGSGPVRIDLGGASSEPLVLGNALKAALNDFFSQKFDMHTHPTTSPGAPTAPPAGFTGTQISDNVLSDIAFTKKS